MSDRPAAVGGPYFTRPVKILLGIVVVGAVLTFWRFAVGLGPSTALNDGYPWGIWIAFDVVTGTALACGGYAVALLVYILNRGRYHPLVRPALLTSALGYSVAAIAIVIDVGRPWFVYRIPISPGKWNLDSALLEVALCVMAYVIVLWLEMSPAFLERWSRGGRTGLARFAERASAILDRSLIWIIALGLVLPTMHQSSLGTVIMLAGPRLHGLWHTAWLPLLFLLSCIAMGYAVVVMESTLSSRAFGLRREDRMLSSMSGVMIVVLGLFLALRFGDLIWEQKLSMAFAGGLHPAMFWLETAIAVAAMVILARTRATRNIGQLWIAAVLIAVFGTLYRFDAYLVAFEPGRGYQYFPSVPEVLITLGLVALEILAYILLVKTFPILSGAPATASDR